MWQSRFARPEATLEYVCGTRLNWHIISHCIMEKPKPRSLYQSENIGNTTPDTPQRHLEQGFSSVVPAKYGYTEHRGLAFSIFRERFLYFKIIKIQIGPNGTSGRANFRGSAQRPDTPQRHPQDSWDLGGRARSGVGLCRVAIPGVFFMLGNKKITLKEDTS